MHDENRADNGKSAPTRERWSVVRAYDGGHAGSAGCEKCGAGLRFVVVLRSSTGREMRVGQDCAITLEGGPELAEIRRAETAWVLEQARLRREAEEPARAAAAATRLETGRRTLARFAITAEALRRVVAEGTPWEREECFDLLRHWEGGFSERPLSREAREMLGRFLRKLDQARGNGHVGTVGEPLAIDVTFHRRTSLHAGRFEARLYHFISDDGAMLVWKTGARPGRLVEGERYSLHGTVKAHRHYEGTNETFVVRVKLTTERGGRDGT